MTTITLPATVIALLLAALIALIAGAVIAGMARYADWRSDHQRDENETNQRAGLTTANISGLTAPRHRPERTHIAA